MNIKANQEATARPWQDTGGGFVKKDGWKICEANGKTASEAFANAALIVRAVNEHDALNQVAEAAKVAANTVKEISSHGDYFANGIKAQLDNAIAALTAIRKQ